MRLRDTACLSLLFCASHLALAWQPQPASVPVFTISGIVVEGRTNQPLRRAHVRIAQNDNPERRASLLTAEDGRFNFTNVPQGKYTLSAEYRGVSHMYQEDGYYSTGIVTGPALDSQHIVFAFPASGTLVVKVLDEEGEPVRAQTILFHKRIVGGWSQIELASQVTTDSEGIGRFPHLEAGTYYVGATGRPWYAQDGMVPRASGSQAESEKQLDLAYPVTYYPETQDPGSASPVEVSEGESAHVQIALRAVPAAKILLQGFPGDQDPARGEQVIPSVEAIGPGGVRIQTPADSYQDNNGRQIGGIAPGNYVVSVTRMSPGENGQEPLGVSRVDVRSETSLTFSNLARTAVSGHLTVEGLALPKQVAIWLGQPSTAQNAFCPVNSDGSFRCNSNGTGGNGGGNVIPGRYQVRVVNSADLYVKSTIARGAEISAGLLILKEGEAADLTVVAAKGTAKVNGIAVRDGRAVSGAMILLIPKDRGLGAGIPRDQSDSDGTFTLQQVLPGSYFLLALENDRLLEYHNRNAIQPYLARAQTVTVPLAPDAPVRVEVQKR